MKKYLSVLFPTICHLCRQRCAPRQVLCEHCWRSLPYLNPALLCQRCGLMLPMAGSSCGQCLTHAFAFDRCYAMLGYVPESARLITRLKFHGQLIVAKLLGELLGEWLLQMYQSYSMPEVIIPIPLHSRRLWRRGFNQSIELAKPVAQVLQIPVALEVLHKQRNIVPQSTLSAKQRKRNVSNVFSVAPHVWKHVALLDDVVTTGATVDAAAKALKASGVEQVDVWCVARTH